MTARQARNRIHAGASVSRTGGQGEARTLPGDVDTRSAQAALDEVRLPGQQHLECPRGSREAQGKGANLKGCSRSRAPVPNRTCDPGGSPSRTRTYDKPVNSRLLYQLSYRGSRHKGTGGGRLVKRPGPPSNRPAGRPNWIPNGWTPSACGQRGSSVPGSGPATGWSAELLGFLEEVAGHPGAAGAYGLGPEDLAVLADQHGGSIGDAGFLEPEAVALRDLTLGVEVGEQREVDPAKAVGPCLVAELGVDGDAQNLGVSGLELLTKRVEAGDLDASCRGEVERVEDEHDVLLALEVGELHGLVRVARQLEVGGVRPHRDDGHVWSVCWSIRGPPSGAGWPFVLAKRLAVSGAHAPSRRRECPRSSNFRPKEVLRGRHRDGLHGPTRQGRHA